jgi:Rrf2 family protein
MCGPSRTSLHWFAWLANRSVEGKLAAFDGDVLTVAVGQSGTPLPCQSFRSWIRTSQKPTFEDLRLDADDEPAPIRDRLTDLATSAFTAFDRLRERRHPMQLTRATEYAIQFLAALAADQTGRRMTAHTVASARKIPFRPLQKLLGRLVKAQILQAVRGRHGGCRLARPPHELTLLEIIEAVEGPSTDAVLWQPKDAALDRRIVTAAQHAEEAGRAQLSNVRLSELAQMRETNQPREPRAGQR